MQIAMRNVKHEIIAKAYYEWMMAEDVQDYPWEGASNETEEEAHRFAARVLEELEELEKPKDRPPMPVSVRKILEDTFTPGGMDKWWTAYLRMDPHAQEPSAREWARRSVANIDLGFRFRNS